MSGWKPGRQGTGYDVLRLFSWRRLRVDGWLLYFPEGSEIPEHRDIVGGRDHYRLNIVLKQAREGGEFYCDWPIFRTRRISIFRSDKPHSVGKIIRGSRYVLSFGWAR